MKEIKKEDRIIARILSGELSFSDADIQKLENADLTEEKEEQLVKLANEITETAKKNKELREDVKNKVENSENQVYNKIDLISIEEDIRDLKEELKLHSDYERGKKLLIGSVITLGIGIAFPIILSFFTGSLAFLLSVLVACFSIGTISTFVSLKQFDNEAKLKQNKIASLEQERLKLLEYKSDDMLETDVKRTQNTIKHIYKNKDVDLTEEEIKSLF